MLIDQVVENSDSSGEPRILDIDDNSQEYDTAKELYALTTTTNSSINENNFLAKSDLVILYENIDVGTKLIQKSNEEKNKVPNQHVETIVYNDEPDSEDSDGSEIYSREDLHNLYMINNERLNILDTISSFGTTLCHKYGNEQIHASSLVHEYGKHFLFKNPYVKEQLKIHSMSQSKYSDSTVLPASLLDYICCKRLEDNYNFYMDDIIKYVQRTIEQLKRISNGDYLTEKTKEKWREVGDFNKSDEHNNTTLLSYADLPVLIESKVNGKKRTWDDIVHSEMDVRCLTRILEKKIIVEIPKLLCGTYKLFSRCYNDNLIISCKKDESHTINENRDESRLNLVVKLKRSNSGALTSNINSVMVLRATPSALIKSEKNNLALELLEIAPERENKLNIFEIEDELNTTIINQEYSAKIREIQVQDKIEFDGNESCSSPTDMTLSVVTPDELKYTMRRLNIKSPVMEENEDSSFKKKTSPMRIRIKSPYENKSYVIEERKRKRLLEIREKRERKKIALNETCKVTKHKYGKGAVLAQSSNSVTRLSITNKSFYNSIYGQALNMDGSNYRKPVKKQSSDHQTENCPTIDLDDEEEHKKESALTPDKDSLKYINHSYYLDEADTEMQNYLHIKSNKNLDISKGTNSPSTSTLSNGIGSLNMFKRLISNTSGTDVSGTDTTSSLHQNILGEENEDNTEDYLSSERTNKILVPTNTPKDEVKLKNDKITSIECRRSIDKIYDLMKKVADTDTNNLTPNKTEIANVKADVGGDSSFLQGSDSGTSFKHQLTSSNPSCISFEVNKHVQHNVKQILKKRVDKPSAIIPKVVINSKLPKSDNRNKEDIKIDSKKFSGNPLKAISQLLHDIDNVQKIRQKSGNEQKSYKKSESLNLESKNTLRTSHSNKRTNRYENEPINSRLPSYKDRKTNQNQLSEINKLPARLSNDKPINKFNKKKIADIIDEVKELKGEAVRGPSKRSRLDSLAKPKKVYVQAQHEEYQAKHGKVYFTEKCKLSPNAPLNTEKNPISIVNKHKRASESLTTSHRQFVNTPSLEKSTKSKYITKISQDDYDKNYSIPAKGPSSLYNKNFVPGALKKKMVAVESYVNNHFGRITPILVPKDNIKSRAPLIPADLDLDSSTSSPKEESTVLGKKIHFMINSMINTKSTPLDALTECRESSIISDKSVEDSDQDVLKIDKVASVYDYDVDIFKDKNIVTAVACLSKENQLKNKVTDIDTISKGKSESHKSENEIRTLENALYTQILNGTFHKRLRIRNFTLTPRASIQPVIVLNSGDDSSLLVKSTISKKICIKSTTSEKFSFPTLKTTSEINILPILSNNSIERVFPVQLATVGYAFTKYQTLRNESKTDIINISDEIQCVKTISSQHEKYDKSLQCNMRFNNSIQNDTKVTLTDVNTNTILQNVTCVTANENIEKYEQNSLNEKEGQNFIKCKDSDVIIENSGNISNSTSLDILVGLLNEIKKITSYPVDLVKHDDEEITYPKNKELEVLLNNSSIQETTPDVSVKNSVSMSSLLSFKQNYLKRRSLCVSSCNDNIEYPEFKNNDTSNIFSSRSNNYTDKEVTAKISEKELVNTFTEVPSQFWVATVNNGVDVVNPLTIFKDVSSQSIGALYDRTTNRLAQKITELRDFNHDVLMATKNKQVNATKNYNTLNTEKFDPMLKMKRDILVTVYSILVLTIFAALTFPDILPRVYL